MQDGRTLHHTAFVVHDVEKTARSLARDLGIGPWSVWTIEPVTCTVHGKNEPYSFRAALAEVGGSRYELVAPHTGRGVYVAHLETKGEGFHHTCLGFDSREAMQRAKAELASQGREMTQSGDMGAIGEFCYFDVPEIGSAVELMYLGELPPPETTIS